MLFGGALVKKPYQAQASKNNMIAGDKKFARLLESSAVYI